MGILASISTDEEEYEVEDFEYDMDDYFSKYIGEYVYVEGRQLGWRNLSGSTEFKLSTVDEIWRKLVPKNGDFSFEIRDTEEENRYEAVVHHHDSPTGEFFNITIGGHNEKSKL
tara:strand:+ start:530 stop:871 length:342 start_codon:yes stop_codon:yes gene_type:complete